MNIVYVCHYFVPEISAPSSRLYDLSLAWVKRGHRVTVVTCFPNHPAGILRPEDRGKLWDEETIDSIRVLRNWVYAAPNEGFVKKTLGHLSFTVTAVLFGLPRLGLADVIIVSSPTFFSVLSAWVMAIVKRAPFVFEVRDLWPAVFVDLGVLKNRPLVAALEWIEMFLYRRAARVVAVTGSFREILIRRGVPAEKVVTITNGADLEFFRPGPRDDSIRAEYGLGDKFVVLYLGAHGISHGLETVIQAAHRLRERDDICFLLVGEGAEKRKLAALADELKLKNVLLIPGQPKPRVSAFYHAADVCMVMLKNVPLFASFIPSKMFEVMAAGRPIIGAVQGEAQSILERSGAAVLIEPENPGALAEAALRLLSNPSARAEMAASGRAFVEAHYDREKLAARYEEVLSGLLFHA